MISMHIDIIKLRYYAQNDKEYILSCGRICIHSPLERNTRQHLAQSFRLSR